MRIIACIIFWYSVAEWLKAEAALVSPRLAESIERLFSAIEFPTHQEWPAIIEKISTIVQSF